MLARTVCTNPSSPSATACLARRYPASNLRWNPTCTGTPAFSTSSTISTVSARVVATGFSQKVGTPAATALRSVAA